MLHSFSFQKNEMNSLARSYQKEKSPVTEKLVETILNAYQFEAIVDRRKKCLEAELH
ncbi:hypothetical protein NRIC_17470 [Enterococcus florum]|uniref:Uncharacterized protein n=1 Tax=Enterococcus florum TaxID=2480627 RepID=A0A4P5P8J6_9ENTE|nr:hypothetical protein NRIC_17470 [Enterococcus florum]